jgi:hypothetical protein
MAHLLDPQQLASIMRWIRVLSFAFPNFMADGPIVISDQPDRVSPRNGRYQHS